MHIGIECNLDSDKDYYIFSDLNYRYDPENKGNNHGYRITSYSEEEIIFENLTENINYNVGDLLRKSMIDYVKKNVNKSKNNGMTIYVTPSYSGNLPFMAAYFENELKNNHLITLNISYKGDKSFCYYCDDYATEDDVKIIKELPTKGFNVVLIMKYTLSSIYSLNYLFITDKRTQEEKDKYQAKIIEKRGKGDLINNSLSDEAKKTETIKKEEKTNDNKIESNKNISSNEKKESEKKSQDNKKDINKATTNVFDEEGEPIQSNASLIQYVKEITGGYIIGLENIGKKKLRVKLDIEGLTLTDSMYKGRGSPTFFIEPKEKKVFNAIIKKGYTGDLSYKFETL